MRNLALRLGLCGAVCGTLVFAAHAPREMIRQLRAREANPVGLFRHEDARVREEAVDAYSAVDDAPAIKVRALIPLLRDPARRVRAAAIRQLVGLPVAKALGPALALLRDSDRRVRSTSCELLATWGPLAADGKVFDELAATLRRYSESEPWPYNVEYAWAAIGVDSEHLTTLRKLLRDRQLAPIRRAQVVRLLGRLGPVAKSVIPDLQQLLKIDPHRLPIRDQWERHGIDGDVTAAREVLPLLTQAK